MDTTTLLSFHYEDNPDTGEGYRRGADAEHDKELVLEMDEIFYQILMAALPHATVANGRASINLGTLTWNPREAVPGDPRSIFVLTDQPSEIVDTPFTFAQSDEPPSCKP